MRRQVLPAVPITTWLPRYRRSALGGDVLAGLVVAALLVPQALGYAGIANVPLEVGLYAVPGALLAYAIFGSSPNLVVGPASTVAVVSGTLIADMGLSGSEAVGATAGMALVAGLVLVAIGLLRIGWVAEFLSAPIVTGFVFGLSLVIIVGEIPSILGIPKDGTNVVTQAIAVARGIEDTVAVSVVVGVAALAVLFLGARFRPRIPWGILVVVVSVVAATQLDLAGRGVRVVGEVPSGLPPLGLPAFPAMQLEEVILGGASLALVGLAEGLSAARLFAARGGYRVDADQELAAAGAANVAAGLCGGLAVAGSLSKTAAAERSGGRSQVTGLTAGVVVVLVLLFFTGFFRELPKPVLSAIVIQAVWGLMDVPALRRFRQVRRADFVAATTALVGVALFGPLTGLLVAIVVSLLAIVYRTSRPRVERLGRIPREKAAWGRLEGHPERRPVRGVHVVRLDGPLYWVNAVSVSDAVLDDVSRDPAIRAVVIDLELTPNLDVTTVGVLSGLVHQLRSRNVEPFLVRVMHQPRVIMQRSGLLEELGQDRVWRSISQGVRAARFETGLKQVAPEEREEVRRRVGMRRPLPVTGEYIATDASTDAEDPAR